MSDAANPMKPSALHNEIRMKTNTEEEGGKKGAIVIKNSLKARINSTLQKLLAVMNNCFKKPAAFVLH